MSRTPLSAASAEPLRETSVSGRGLGDVIDRGLIEGIAHGDGDALLELFGRHAPTTMALATRILRQPYLAEEIVQEAFLAVWLHPDRYRAERGTVRWWLMSIVHHRAVDLVRREEAHRKRAAETVSVDRVEKLPADPGEVVVEAISLAEDQKAARRALCDLPAQQRQIIELMYFGGLSQTQISERLSLPLGTVKSRTLVGMRRLRTTLSGMER
jgi:RNA polymerase sigma factor (sigma-70 family)